MSGAPDQPNTRRHFVAALAAGAAVAAVTLASRQKRNGKGEASTGAKLHYGMLIDVRRCIGCHSCSVACKSEHGVPAGVNRNWVEYVDKGEYPNVSRSFLPRLCNHCSVPQCVSVCPTGATYKRPQDGIVVINSGLCIGCKYCIQACPYDARFLNPHTGFADKCDFCAVRVARGLVPACVETCIGGALIFGDVGDPDSTISRLIAKNPVSVLRREMGTMPNVYYIAADHTDDSDASRPEVRYVRITTHRPQLKRR